MANHQIPKIVTSSSDPSLSGSGHFLPGTEALFFFTFPDINGNLYDPSDLDIEITDPSSTSIETGTSLDKLELGQFAYAWDIPTTADSGVYTLTLTYTVETSTGSSIETFTEQFIVGEEQGGGVISVKQIALRAFLESLIGYIQRIPVFNEIARLNKDRTEGRLTFPRWNQPAGARIYSNGKIKETGYTVDYMNGKIFFDSALTSYDEITVDYNFRWFDDFELDAFIQQGINLYNLYPPATFDNTVSLPVQWSIAVEYAAAVDVIRRWMMDILFQEPAKVFGGPERADKIFGNMDTLKKNYEDTRDKLLEQKKFGPYLGLTKTVTVPEYTLPGGRSRWFRYLFKGA